MATYKYRGFEIESLGRGRGCFVYNAAGADVSREASGGYSTVWAIDMAKRWIDGHPAATAKRTRAKPARFVAPRAVSDGGRRACGFANEKNDCVVRAIANTRCISYAESHALCADIFGRKDGRGTYYTALIMGRQKWARKTETTARTLDAFAAAHPVGHFFVLVANHAVAVCDGVIHDSWKISGLKRVECAFEVIA